MVVSSITIDEAFRHWNKFIILDVRSPIEYNQGHIPNSFNLPIFSNEERTLIGTTFKQKSVQLAKKIGLEIFGKNLINYLQKIESIKSLEKEKTLLIYCWRGGLRSYAIQWLCNIYGLNSVTIKGGYKSYRRWCSTIFKIEYPFIVIGGFTGVNKTKLLEELETISIPVINLEKISDHRGSAFGGLGKNSQCSNEMFENKLAFDLFNKNKLLLQNNSKFIFIEDESQRIGNHIIPIELFKNMRNSTHYIIYLTPEQRLNNIIETYAKFSISNLIECTCKLKKRLGSEKMNLIINFLRVGELEQAFKHLLTYYDKYYSNNNSHKIYPKKQTINIDFTYTSFMQQVEFFKKIS